MYRFNSLSKNARIGMKKALVVGGNSGIGLSLTLKLIEHGYDHIYIVGKDEIDPKDLDKSQIDVLMKHISFAKLNLINQEFSVLDDIWDINTLIITAGFGRVCAFEDLTDAEVSNLIKCNLLGIIQIIKKYYGKIKNKESFYCAVMGSIAGHVASPLFSVYGASKSGLCSFIESVNTELKCEGYENRILDVSPGALKGTNFNGEGNSLSLLSDISNNVLDEMFGRKTLFIPMYDEVFSNVINRYHTDPVKYSAESYFYKKNNHRISEKTQVVVGYLSGTFDLFHIGHLNLLRKAKEQCDYLIVGVHKSGAWKGKETYIPFDERVQIVAGIKYVDKVIESYVEDSDAYDALHFDKLFVGSDYKGTERFRRYEEYFNGKGVEIIYFPYTAGTSSTQLRAAISK